MTQKGCPKAWAFTEMCSSHIFIGITLDCAEKSSVQDLNVLYGYSLPGKCFQG